MVIRCDAAPDFSKERFSAMLMHMQHENTTATGRTPAIDILFEDDDVVVINKPSGIMVHADGYTDGPTVVDWFIRQYPDAAGVGEPATLTTGSRKGEPLDRSGVVHRLDTETSGVLLLAKHQNAFIHLKRQFHDRHTKKEYRAFVYGTMKEDHGTIDRPIGRSAKDFRLRSAQRGAKGTLREAHTEWELLGTNNGHSYLRMLPKTGRTHQIRAHAKAIDHPVVCDRLYAPNHQCALGFTRLALHAFRLSLVLPGGVERAFEAPLPEVFVKAAAGCAQDED